MTKIKCTKANYQNSRGQAVLDMAKNEGNKKIIKMLESAK